MCGSRRASRSAPAALAALAVAACGPAGPAGDAVVRISLPTGEATAGLTGTCEQDGLFSLPVCPVFVELTVRGEGLDLEPIRWPETAEQLAGDEAELALTLSAGPAREFRCTAFRGAADSVEVFSEVSVAVVDLRPGASVDVLLRLRRGGTVGVRGTVPAGTVAVEVVDVEKSVLLIRAGLPEESRLLELPHVPTGRVLAWTLVAEDGTRTALEPLTLDPGEPAWRTLQLSPSGNAAPDAR